MIGSHSAPATSSKVGLEKYNLLFESSQKNVAPWWKDLKLESANRFSHLGLPKRSLEEWRYTDLSNMELANWGLAEAKTSQTQQKVATESLAQLSRESQNFFVKLTSKFNERFPGESLVDLNLALGLSGQFHQVAGADAASLQLVHSGEEPEKIFSPYHLICLKKNSRLELTEDFAFLGKKESWINACIDIYLEEGAMLDYYQLQNNSETTRQTSTVRIIQSQNSTVRTWSVQTGSRMARSSFFVGLDGEHSQFHFRALSMVRPHQHLDQYLYLDHAVPNCTSRQLFKGIVSENGKSIFNGRVIVRKYAQKTDAGQLSKNLLLGPKAEANARPQLEIYADDVKCAHGSTIGRLNREELFYLQSRALSIEQSISLLCHGYAEDVVQDMPNDAVKRKFLMALAQSFETLTIGELGG